MISAQALRQASLRMFEQRSRHFREVPRGEKVPGKQHMQKSWGTIGPGLLEEH